MRVACNNARKPRPIGTVVRLPKTTSGTHSTRDDARIVEFVEAAPASEQGQRDWDASLDRED